MDPSAKGEAVVAAAADAVLASLPPQLYGEAVVAVAAAVVPPPPQPCIAKRPAKPATK